LIVMKNLSIGDTGSSRSSVKGTKTGILEAGKLTNSKTPREVH
jgi:hypothetical protein